MVNSNISLFFCGDIMPGGMFPYQSRFIDEDLLSYMKSFDLRIGTLEAAIGTDLPYDENKMAARCNIVFARDEDLTRVSLVGMDVLSLANNHVYDLGEEGLYNTMRQLDKYGIKYCGAGQNLSEAKKPAIVELHGKKIAFLAACTPDTNQVGTIKVATEKEAGINPINENNFFLDIIKAKQDNDYVIILPHWGKEHIFLPMPEIISMSKKMIDAGADAVIGSHTHVAQPTITYKGKPIYFGMGNFLFPDYFMKPPRPIWYPSLEEIKPDFEKVVGYPFPIEKPTIHVWPEKSRIGMVVECNIFERRISTDWKLTYLNDNNVVSIKENSLIRRKIKLSRIIVRTPRRVRLFDSVMLRIKRLCNLWNS